MSEQIKWLPDVEKEHMRICRQELVEYLRGETVLLQIVLMLLFIAIQPNCSGQAEHESGHYGEKNRHDSFFLLAWHTRLPQTKKDSGIKRQSLQARNLI